ncbi:MAG: UDP-N-acetylmuramoyl-L-alanine--D-glutamate ligase [Selenomonadaceae bacterium]|nr:UDP-N-acetylmuramoyl-L-alanine--D-glutamate ligase [Selenomonadaceae bacterium]
MEFKNKKILVIGAGISGFAAAKIAKKFGADVTLSDSKSESDLKYNFDELRSLDINLKFGKQNDDQLDGVDLIIVSPAVPLKIPLLQSAINRGIEIISEVELAFDLASSPIFAVTGTNGKTTTVTLLGLLLETAYKKVGVGGNIGVALSEVALDVSDGGCIAAEISSYQMESTKNFHPHVSAILNVTPDHLKRHGSMENYQAMKEKIFSQETANDFLVLNYDDDRCRGMIDRANCKVFYFSRKTDLDEGAILKGDQLIIKWNNQIYNLCTIDELGIKGNHNIENALAASAVAFLAGADPQKMIEVLKKFTGVEHRIEFVREIDGVKYYNDSKATNTDSAIKALETFNGKIILIAGGDDKGTDLTDFMQLVKARVDELILVGDAAARFKQAAIDNNFDQNKIHEAGYSMNKAVEIAKNISHADQIVLLSPACASFDMYDGFESRGKDFKKIVKELISN